MDHAIQCDSEDEELKPFKEGVFHCLVRGLYPSVEKQSFWDLAESAEHGGTLGQCHRHDIKKHAVS